VVVFGKGGNKLEVGELKVLTMGQMTAPTRNNYRKVALYDTLREGKIPGGKKRTSGWGYKGVYGLQKPPPNKKG